MFNILKSLLKRKKVLDISKLPSQGLFYKKDFEITINSVSKDEIKKYEESYVKDDIYSLITQIKSIVRNNTTFKNGYTYDYIRSIDIVFIFLEIVRLTIGKPINLIYEKDNKEYEIEFCSENFNYFKIDKDNNQNLYKKYDPNGRYFEIEGYKYSITSIGIENKLTDFLMRKADTTEKISMYNSYNYNFTYFLSDKNNLNDDEIDNLIQIFNIDMPGDEMEKINNIINMFSPMQTYSLNKDGYEIDLSAKIDLSNIWKK